MNGGDATHYMRFPQNENGKINIENGTYDDADVCILKVKSDKEVRLCLGCAMIEWQKAAEVLEETRNAVIEEKGRGSQKEIEK